MVPPVQAKLLRFLAEGEYYRVGEPTPSYSSARVIAATNRDLDQTTEAGQFRADLLHRLNAIELTLPPLRQRPGSQTGS